ncbi:MAG: hypothetical protein ACI90R_002127 [Alteromonas macleodii]|jgi:hypothetical protein
MTFKEWINRNCPSFDDKLNACANELRDAASVVDIDYLGCNLSIGANRPRDISVLSSESKGRCRVYVNSKEYDGMDFPHVVFVNMRQQFSDKATGKSTPSVVNAVGVLFERYQQNLGVSFEVDKKLNMQPAALPNRTILVNEQRAWFAKMRPYSNDYFSKYLANKGVKSNWIVEDPTLNFRLGMSRRYGKYVALPFRYLHQDTFMGFQRIYDDGSKIMMREFNPNGLCGYMASNPEALEPSGVKTIILWEGWANGLLSHFMCKEMGLNGVVNIVGLYADNLPILTEIIKSEMPHVKNVINVFDNDANHKGEEVAKRCKAILPSMAIDCLPRNDLADMVRDFSFPHAKKALAQVLKRAFQ